MAVSCALRFAHQPTPIPPSCFPFQPINIKTEMPSYDYGEPSPGWALESKLSFFKRCKTDFNIPEESQLTSWTKKHPQHWTREEVLDWVYFVVDQLHLDGSLVRGEAYQTITGSRLCQMSRHDFHVTDPQYGTRLYDIFRDLLEDVDIQAPKPIEDDTAINFDYFAEHHNNSYNFPPRSWDRENNNHNHNHNLSMAISVNPKSLSFFGNNDNKDAINTNIVVYGQDNDVKVDLRGLGVYSISTDIEFPSAHAAGQRTTSSSSSSQPTSSLPRPSLSSLDPVSTSSSGFSFLDAHPVVPMSSSPSFPHSMNKSQISPSLSSILSLPTSLPTQQQQQQQQQQQHLATPLQSQVRLSPRSSTSPPQTSSPVSSSAISSPPLPYTVTSLDSLLCHQVSSMSSSSPSSSLLSLGSSSTSTTFNTSMTQSRRASTASHSSSPSPLTSSFSSVSSMPRSSIISSTSSLGSTDLSSSTIRGMDVGDPDYVSDDDLFVNPLSEDVEMAMEVSGSFPDDLVMCSNGMRDTKRRKSKGGHSNKGTHLWEFVRDLLRDPNKNPKILKWEDKESGVFRFVRSEAVAQLWGEKKKNPLMTYEKLSRAMRFCRSIGYFNNVPKNGKFPKKLCFMFGDKARGWKD